MAPTDHTDSTAWTAGTPFGRIATAMITPFTADGALDLDGAQKLAAHLVDAGNDALVVNGTTGESPTTSDAEKADLVRAVVAAVGDRAKIIAGTGTNDTRHTVELSRQAEAAGADGLLVVTPYYSKTTQEGLFRHFSAVADATGLPVLLYDIPPRSVIPIETDTLLRLAEHPRIVGVKDAKGDLGAGAYVMGRTDLAYYCGDDPLNLPWLAVGAVGMISIATHFCTPELRAMTAAYLSGDVAGAAAIHRRLMPAYYETYRRPGLVSAKAAMNMLGLPGGPVRLPLVDATSQEQSRLKDALAESGVKI